MVIKMPESCGNSILLNKHHYVIYGFFFHQLPLKQQQSVYLKELPSRLLWPFWLFGCCNTNMSDLFKAEHHKLFSVTWVGMEAAAE